MKGEIRNSAKLFVANELILSKVYIIWAVICVISFGIFGIGTLTYSLSEKISLYKEMRDMNYRLNVKLQALSDVSDKLKQSQQYMPLLEANIPPDLNTHSYMVLFMQETSLSGFSVKTFTPATESHGGEVPINVVLEGAGDISNLTSRLESLSRVTVLDEVKYEKNTDNVEVSINLRIFNIK